MFRQRGGRECREECRRFRGNKRNWHCAMKRGHEDAGTGAAGYP